MRHPLRALAGLMLSMLLGLPVLPLQAEPVAWDRDGEHWLTRTSEHFAIHYLSSYDGMAQRALAIAEQVHTGLLPYFGQTPASRTQMVLTDDYDFSNGWATPFPFAQIRLYASPPEDVAGLEHMDEWLHGLIRHEYVHVLHMEMSRGVVRKGRRVFGRLVWFFPHVFIPSLFKEGLAVYLETDHGLGYGRLDSSFYAMQMRMELAGAGADDLNQVVVPLRDWPLGKNYLYGAYFIDYLAATYGDHALENYLTLYSGQLIPYFLQNPVARRSFGQGFNALWNDYRRWLMSRFAAQISRLQAEEVSGRNLPLMPDRQQVTAAAGEQLLVVVNNAQDRPYLSRWTDHSGHWQRDDLLPSRSITDVDQAADGTLAISRLITHASGRMLNDLFLWSERDGWQRLTSEMRFRKVRWSGDGQILYASRKQHGLSELWRFRRDGDGQMIWQSSALTVLGGFDVSPDGTSLVAAVKRPQQGWNLEQLHLGSLQWQPLTDTRASENAPEFLPDGRVLYSADYDGVYNLYVLQPDTGEAEQWSRVVGGAFQPHWLNGRVLYQEYSAEGYQLKLLQPQPLARFTLADQYGRYNYPPAAERQPESVVSAYSPWSTLRPRYWFPLWNVDDYSNSIGLTTSGSDALSRHIYSLSASWDFRQDWADFYAGYAYDNRWLAYWQRKHSYTDLDLNVDDNWYARREDLLGIQRNHLLDFAEDRLQLHAGITADHQKIVRAPSGINSGHGYEETLAGLAFSFDNREFYRNVPGTGWGSYADLVYETNDVLNSDYDGAQWQGQWWHTFDLPGRQTVTFAAAAGIADRGAEPFTLGGLDSEENLLFGRDEFSLPGYDDHVQIGHKYYNSRLSYRRWLSRIERNWGLTPLGLGDISASAWVQTGSAWFREQHNPQLTSVGAELITDLVVGYSAVLPLRLGIAHGLDQERGKTVGYLRLEATF